jgi:hypothetical protein
MAEKCAVCGGGIELVFLEKIHGTWLRDSKGKKRAVCASCQQQLPVADLRKKL